MGSSHVINPERESSYQLKDGLKPMLCISEYVPSSTGCRVIGR